MNRLLCLTLLATAVFVASALAYDLTETHGYHFHTYFFQNDPESREAAEEFWRAIEEHINNGTLKGCRLNIINSGPRGPHPVGSFETCCNNTEVSHSLSWFMQNRGDLSIFFHPLTTEQLLDHTVRSSFLGDRFKLNLDNFAATIPESEVDLCLPIIFDHQDNEVY